MDVTVACVFNPAVTGDEDHDEDGSYEAPESGLVSVDRARYAELVRIEKRYYQGYRDSSTKTWVTPAYLEYLEERSEKLGVYEDRYGELAE